MDSRLAAVPRLVRRLSSKGFGGSTVEKEDSSAHSLPPKFSQHAPLFQRSTRHCHHCLVPPLDDTILLRRLRCGEVELAAFIGRIGSKLRRGKLAAIVRVFYIRSELLPLPEFF